MWCNQRGAISAVRTTYAHFDIVNSTARAIIPPTHPPLGSLNTCGGDFDECSGLAGASLRPR
eukprot:7200110-Pyramimonas_sp.AAC.1